MDTKILQPYILKTKEKEKNHEFPESTEINIKDISKADKVKEFNNYTKTFRKDDTAWKSLNTYSSLPYLDQQDLRIREKNKEGKKIFILGNKNDVWDSIIKKSESNRTLQSYNQLKSFPDMKAYKKSLEHIITKKLYFK